jgi:hypothetical protein
VFLSLCGQIQFVTLVWFILHFLSVFKTNSKKIIISNIMCYSLGSFKVIVSNEAQVAQLEPLLLLLSNEMRLELNIGSAQASIVITFK